MRALFGVPRPRAIPTLACAPIIAESWFQFREIGPPAAMWIVRLALRRPYTFVVMAMLIAILGVVSIVRMPTDIFPEIDIPVISVIFNYRGMSPDDMETRVVGNFERVLVYDRQRHRASSKANRSTASRSSRSSSSPRATSTPPSPRSLRVPQAALRNMPPGIYPPLVIAVQRVERADLAALARQRHPPRTAALRPGDQRPAARHGHRARRADPLPLRRQACGRSWSTSIRTSSTPGTCRPPTCPTRSNAQNLILPAGTAKIGTQEYHVRLNSSPAAVAAISDLPIKTIGTRTIYIRDVAHVRDGFAVQTNIVHVDGKRGVLHADLEIGGASTLDVVSGVKRRLPAPAGHHARRSCRSRRCSISRSSSAPRSRAWSRKRPSPPGSPA